MAFQLVQEFNFDNVEYSYDRARDVLYISFGPPVPAIAIQVEDWLALRIALEPPQIVGMTIVGFKRIFEKINQYIEQELPERIRRLVNVSLGVSYDDEKDALIVRLSDHPPSLSIFEPLVSNVYLEKSIPSKDIVGVKILEFTKCGPSAVEDLFGKVVDTIFEPEPKRDENAHLITNALIQILDRRKLAALAA